MTAMSVSPNKRYAAIAEKKAEKPTITIYDLTTLRRRKVLSTLECTSQEFVSLAFSPDSKYLTSQLGAPDWTLTYWHWEKGRVMASTKSNGATNYHVHQVGNSTIIFKMKFSGSLCSRKRGLIGCTYTRTTILHVMQAG